MELTVEKYLFLQLNMALKIALLFGIFAFASAGDLVASGGVSDSQQSQDDTGSYSFGYNIVDEFGTKGRTESGDEYGNKKGYYYLSDADGRTRRVDYIADELGFRASINTNEPGTMDSAPASVAYYAEGAPNVVIKTPAKVIAPAYTATPAKVVAPAYAATPAKILTSAAPAKIIAPTYSEIPPAKFVTRVHAPAYTTHIEPAPLLSPAKVVAPAYAAVPPPPPPPARYIAPAAPLLTPAKVVAPAYHAPLLSSTKVVAPAYHAPLLSTTKVVAPAYHAPIVTPGRVLHHAPLLSPAKVVAPAYATHAKVVAPAPLLSTTKIIAPAQSYSTSSKTVVHHPAPLVKYHAFH